ncbi:glycosyltransferase family 2 protein [Acidisoma sp. C75]
MDIFGPDFAALMRSDLSPSGLQALRGGVLPMANDGETTALLDWLITAMERGAQDGLPHAELPPVDARYVEALVSVLGKRPSERIQELPRHFDFLAFTRLERVWSPFKLLNFFYRGKMEPTGGAAIVTSVRNEGINLLEWIAHHRLLGFDEFFFYVNDSDDGTVEILKALAAQELCYVIVNETHLGREGGNAFPIQSKAFEHALHFLDAVRAFKWLLFSDVDEYLVTRPLIEDASRTRPLDDLLAKLESDSSNLAGVAFSWKWFISNAAYSREDGLHFERFQASRCSDHIKSLVRLRRCTRFPTSHLPDVIVGSHFLDGSLARISELGIQLPPTYGYGQLNHYWNKSFEEFVAKRNRERGHRSLDQFFSFGDNRSFGQVELVPQPWIERLKIEVARLRELPNIDRLYQQAERHFRQEIQAFDASHNLPYIYIKNRFPIRESHDDLQSEDGSDLGVMRDSLAPRGVSKPLPLLHGTEYFAPVWMQYWHGSGQDNPWREVVCWAFTGGIVSEPGTIWMGDRRFDVSASTWGGPSIEPVTATNDLPIRQIRTPCVVLPGKSATSYGGDLSGQLLRIWVARTAADRMRLPLLVLVDQPAPEWLPHLLKEVADVPREDIEFYSPAEERVLLWHALAPVSPLGPQGLNPMINQLVERIIRLQKPAADVTQVKRIFLTQRSRRPPSDPECQNEAELVELAVRRHGFTPIAIESVNFERQITLFRDAEIVLSNAFPHAPGIMFCGADARVGSIGARSLGLSEIGALRGFRNAYFTLGIESRSRFSIDPLDFERFLEALCA